MDLPLSAEVRDVLSCLCAVVFPLCLFGTVIFDDKRRVICGGMMGAAAAIGISL
jgi:hypothetical protein